MTLKCPVCGWKFYVSALCSNPLQYEGECGHLDFRLRYYERQDPFKKITQEELNNVSNIKAISTDKEKG
jgi:hypothetical protein